jgi:hypothetical protein
MRRVVALGTFLAVLSAGSFAFGFLDPTAPVRIVLLAEIADALKQAYQTLREVNDTVWRVRDRLDTMFPWGALHEIESDFREIRTIQQQLTDLSCSWRFSPRMQILKDGLLGVGPLCRREYQAVFGAPVLSPDQDLAEFQQWQGVVRLNQVRDTLAASEGWTEAANWLGREARRGYDGNASNPTSVGYSMRLMGESQALGLQIEARLNALEAMRLAGLQEEFDTGRRVEWERKNSAVQTLVGVSLRASNGQADPWAQP